MAIEAKQNATATETSSISIPNLSNKAIVKTPISEPSVIFSKMGKLLQLRWITATYEEILVFNSLQKERFSWGWPEL